MSGFMMVKKNVPTVGMLCQIYQRMTQERTDDMVLKFRERKGKRKFRIKYKRKGRKKCTRQQDFELESMPLEEHTSLSYLLGES